MEQQQVEQLIAIYGNKLPIDSIFKGKNYGLWITIQLVLF